MFCVPVFTVSASLFLILLCPAQTLDHIVGDFEAAKQPPSVDPTLLQSTSLGQAGCAAGQNQVPSCHDDDADSDDTDDGDHVDVHGNVSFTGDDYPGADGAAITLTPDVRWLSILDALSFG